MPLEATSDHGDEFRLVVPVVVSVRGCDVFQVSFNVKPGPEPGDANARFLIAGSVRRTLRGSVGRIGRGGGRGLRCNRVEGVCSRRVS